MRLWPRSFLGQVLLAVALALLVAQTISAVLLWQAAENRRQAAILNTAAIRFVTAPPDRIERGTHRIRPRGGGLRALRIETTATDPILPGETRDRDAEHALRELLEAQGIRIGQLVATRRMATDDPLIRSRPRLLARLQRRNNANRSLLVAGLKRGESPQWEVVRVPFPRPQRGVIGSIIIQTLVIYIVLVGLHFLLLRRITRPLRALTTRTESFARNQDRGEPVSPDGPDDVRRLIGAHNRMEARIEALLNEKDVMLGAIGHDLKTPLAALRVRIEAVEDEAERARMAAGIEDITRSLDDILSLARIGRAGEPPERADLAALVASVVEEFEDMNQPVTLRDADRIALPVQMTWLKRALRNLISNAVRYGGEAEVSLLRESRQTVLRVEDKGPGIPGERLDDMLEPFTRGETSRNRETGGAGLGLTLARAIAEQHGGQLALANRPEGGLRAEIRLPPAD